MVFSKSAIFIIFTIICTINTNSTKYEDINYNIYYLTDPDVIVCSSLNQKHLLNNFVLNEYEIENGYVCLLKLYKNGLYRLNLNFSVLKNSEDHLSNIEASAINNKEANKRGINDSVDISLGNFLIANGLSTIQNKENTELIHKKHILIKFL